MSVEISPSLARVRIGTSPIDLVPIFFGGSWYMPYAGPAAQDEGFLAAMQAAYEFGIRHFDTAATYGKGHSETLYGQFLKGKRDSLFIASKYDPPESTAAAIHDMVRASMGRLGVERIDLYYIHWPRSGRDMRPVMEGLERARAEGLIGAVGVSNFPVETMRQVMEVGRIDAHQLGHNLLWRYAEDEVIPYCRENGIVTIAYSTLAHGILTGKFARDLDLPPGDQRHAILPFRPDIWPHVHAAVEEMKAVAAEIDRPLAHLALRWSLSRPGIDAVVIGGRDAAQVNGTLPALTGEIPATALERLTAISDDIVRHIPNAGNLFGRVG